MDASGAPRASVADREIAYRPAIDGLRAVAVLSVVVYHATPTWLPGGFTGVDVFFVISGYLITSLLAAEVAATGRIDIAAFYTRRIRRLMPALWLVLVAVVLAGAVLLGPRGVAVHPVVESTWASLAFVANLHFQQQAGDYFAGAADQQPLLHLWSLAVEEQFYLVFPLLLWLALRRGGGHAKAIIGALALGSLLLAEHWVQFRPGQAFYQMPARYWELAAGALVALSPRDSRVADRAGSLAAIGLSLVVAAAVATPFGRAFPGFAALPAVTGSALLLYAVHLQPTPGRVGAWLSTRAMVWIGLCSYGWYLWHWPLLAIDRSLRFGEAPVAWKLALCAAALGLAACSLVFVERPMRRLAWPARRWFVAALLVSAAIAGAAGLSTRVTLLPADIERLVADTRADFPRYMGTCHFGQHGKFGSLRGSGCDTRPGVPPRIALWGDSHAASWHPFLVRYAEAHDRSATALTMASCTPLSGYDGRNHGIGGFAARCSAFNAAALQRLTTGGFDTVVIAARWPASYGRAEFASTAPDPDPEPDPATARTMEARLSAALDRLAAVPDVLVLGPVPELRDAAPKCIAAGRPESCAFDRSAFDAAVADSRALLERLALAHPNVTIVDPAPFFCDDRRCRLMRGGHSLYFDDDHVSATAAREFADDYLADPARYTRLPVSAPEDR